MSGNSFNRSEMNFRPRGPSRWAWSKWLGLLLLFLLLVPLRALPQVATFSFDPPLLLPVLNTIFLSFAGFVISYLTARAFVRTGVQAALWLGAGTLTIGFASLISGWLTSTAGRNFGVTVYNSGVLLGSVFNFIGAVVALRAVFRLGRLGRAGFVGIVFSAGLAWVILVSILAFFGLTPVFFVPGAGGTPLRQVVLYSSIFLFTLSGLLLLRAYARSRSPFWVWYSSALLMTAFGLLVVTFSKVLGDPLNWLGRIAQYAGGIFFMVW